MKQKVIRAKQSPLNKMQWHCDLDCGHSEWVTSKRRPVVVECNAQHSAHPTLLDSTPLEALPTPEHSATSQTDQTPQQRG